MDTRRERPDTAYIPTSEHEAGARDMDCWQPERLTLAQGWKGLSVTMRVLYGLILLGTGCLNCLALGRLPEQVSLLTWFGFSSVTVPSLLYAGLTFGVIAYLCYRDIVNRSLSRRKLFIPLVFCLGNYFMIAELLGLAA